MDNLVLFGFFAFCFFSMTTLLQLGVQYRIKVSYHPLARHESCRALCDSRRVLRDSCSTGSDSPSARWPKNCKYICITAKILERFQASMVKLYCDKNAKKIFTSATCRLLRIKIRFVKDRCFHIYVKYAFNKVILYPLHNIDN